MTELLETLAKIGVMLATIIGTLPALIWAERKGAAYIQDRSGPNRASIGGVFRLAGLVHPLADVLKLVFKEDLVPSGVHRFFYTLAPFLMMVVALCTYAVIPFGDELVIAGRQIPLQVANLNVGILYILAISSLSVYGTVLAGWSSNNKFSFLGGLRASAQMISYEIVMGLAILALLLVYGSPRLSDMVYAQGGLLFGFLPRWGVLLQPLGFILFLVALFAETNRNPFDLPEGESELVAGYHTEYSGLKFTLFYMAEYCNLVVGAAITATLFFGGWQVPWLSTDDLRSNGGALLTATVAVASSLNLLFATILLRRFERDRGRLGDLRELEPLILGLVFLALCIGGLIYLALGEPWRIGPSARNHLATSLQFGSFLVKTLCIAWLFIWVRWTLPRFRYDQLMRLGWQYMLPLALLNFLLTAAVLLVLG